MALLPDILTAMVAHNSSRTIWEKAVILLHSLSVAVENRVSVVERHCCRPQSSPIQTPITQGSPLDTRTQRNGLHAVH